MNQEALSRSPRAGPIKRFDTKAVKTSPSPSPSTSRGSAARMLEFSNEFHQGNATVQKFLIADINHIRAEHFFNVLVDKFNCFDGNNLLQSFLYGVSVFFNDGFVGTGGGEIVYLNQIERKHFTITFGKCFGQLAFQNQLIELHVQKSESSGYSQQWYCVAQIEGKSKETKRTTFPDEVREEDGRKSMFRRIMSLIAEAKALK